VARLHRTGVVAVLMVALAGCITAPRDVRQRETYWRQVLAERAPAGTGKSDVLLLFEQYGLPVSERTYRTALPGGGETSNCRLPDQAVSAIERGAVRGLYLNWDIEITVCLDERDRVEKHYVGAWNAGI
jgi:hypothetical protein